MGTSCFLSPPFKFAVLTATCDMTCLFKTLSLPFKFVVLTAEPHNQCTLSSPFKFVVLTATDIYGKRYQYPVAAFQIPGVYNRQPDCLPDMHPVTAFQIQGAYSRRRAKGIDNAPITTFQIPGVYN